MKRKADNNIIMAAAQRPIAGVFDRRIPVERIRQEAVGCFLGPWSDRIVVSSMISDEPIIGG